MHVWLGVTTWRCDAQAGVTALHTAAFAGLKSMGQYFVASGADPASKTIVSCKWWLCVVRVSGAWPQTRAVCLWP